MARVVLRFKDEPNGLVHVSVDFEPPLKNGEEPTPAQVAACRALEATEIFHSENDEEESP